MKRTHLFATLAAAVLAVLAPSAWPADDVKPARLPLAKSELLAPRFHATGRLSLVRPAGGNGVDKDKVVRDFGAGAVAEREAYAIRAVTLSGRAPVIVKRVFTHYRCPPRRDDSSRPNPDTDCKPMKISYTLPANDPTDAAALAECNVSVDVDVLYLGHRGRTISWVLDPVSPTVTTSGGLSKPRIRLLEKALDPSGDEVRGITFSDNNDYPRERGNSLETATGLVFDSPASTADGQKVVWTRAIDARRHVAKVFYYAVVLQSWSDTLQDYVFCAPYDPTIVNRGS